MLLLYQKDKVVAFYDVHYNISTGYYRFK